MKSIGTFLNAETVTKIELDLEWIEPKYAMFVLENTRQEYIEKIRNIEVIGETELVKEFHNLKNKLISEEAINQAIEEENEILKDSYRRRNEFAIIGFFKNRNFSEENECDKILIDKMMDILFQEKIFSQINYILFRNSSFLSSNIKYYDPFFNLLEDRLKLKEPRNVIFTVLSLKRLENVAPRLFEEIFIDKTMEKLSKTNITKEFLKENEFLVKDIFSNMDKKAKFTQNFYMFLEKYADIKIKDEQYILEINENGISAKFEDFYTVVGKNKKVERELREIKNTGGYIQNIQYREYTSALRKMLRPNTAILEEMNPEYKLKFRIKDGMIDFTCHPDVKTYIYKLLSKEFLSEEVDLNSYLREIELNKKLSDKLTSSIGKKKI